MITDTLITFEHPVNEHVRLYLRLEYLQNEFQKHIHKTEASSSKQALIALLKMINVVDRPDLKSKLVQQLNAHKKNLAHLSTSPDIDTAMLQDILQQLDSYQDYLHNHKGIIGAQLHKNDFLNQIRLRLSHPTGASESTLPSLNLWLHKAAEIRQAHLQNWHHVFSNLLNAISLLLKLLRQGTHTTKVVAHSGFYQQNQDPALACSLLRISIASELDVFPEFSANKHRIIIRFMRPDLEHGRKPTQVRIDVPFHLRCCRI